jgi:hypothetical protein
MTFTTPAAGVLQTLDVLLHLSSKGTFDDVVGVDLACDARDLMVGEVLRTGVGVHLGSLENELCGGWTDPMDVLQGVQDLLVFRDVDAGDTRHGLALRSVARNAGVIQPWRAFNLGFFLLMMYRLPLRITIWQSFVLRLILL